MAEGAGAGVGGFHVAVPVRDGKNPRGPVLVIDRAAWAAFVAGVRQ